MTDVERLTAPFPKNCVKQRKGAANRTFDYIEGETCIRRLNEATGNNWDFKITHREWVGDVLLVTGELALPGLGTRSGMGVQRYAANSGEDLLKGAITDCLKKCATLFGVALELYGEDLEAKAQGGQAPHSQPPAQRQSTADRVESAHPGTYPSGGDPARGLPPVPASVPAAFSNPVDRTVCADCGKADVPENSIKYAKSVFGRTLCIDCQKAAAPGMSQVSPAEAGNTSVLEIKRKITEQIRTLWPAVNGIANPVAKEWRNRHFPTLDIKAETDLSVLNKVLDALLEYGGAEELTS